MEKADRIQKFLEKYCVYRSDCDYTFLNRRQMFVAFVIMKQLIRAKDGEIGKRGAVNKQDLFNEVKASYYDYCKKYPNQTNITELKNSIFTTVLFRLDGIFLQIRQMGSQSNKERGIHSFYEIRITPLGAKLFERWIESIGGNENEENKQETA